MVIGSGPIVIGQAAEFDYAGTQACRTLKEEGIEVVLVNSNPATIMTDTNMADKVYIEPLSADILEKIIVKERPDSLLPTLGGQTGLNLAMELAESGFLDKMDVKLLGTATKAIKMAEDRQSFKDAMESIGEPCVASKVVNTVKDALSFADDAGYPVIVRPAYTLGGTGGGIAVDSGQLAEIASSGLRLSRVSQVLIEKCISGWKEIEFEVMRDKKGNAVIVCGMENVDPVGVHTGDSIVVAPCLTLSDREYKMLHSAAIKIINALEIEGGCNIQFALHPTSMEYAVIEVNPRVSRSSALASKASGYPIARVATKIAIGYSLDEIGNKTTGKTLESFEPVLDYIVLKMPRWPFDKFVRAKRTLGTQMKATGEVMAISDTFEGALMKAIRSLEIGISTLEHQMYKKYSTDEIEKKLGDIDDERLFVIAEALRRGITGERIFEITGIDPYFLKRISNIVEMEEFLKTHTKETLSHEHIRKAKETGFTDNVIAGYAGCSTLDIRKMRKDFGINAVFRTVDTCTENLDAVSPYYYSIYGQCGRNGDQFGKSAGSGRKKVLVIGSGPIRIGQGIEFDYCSVHSVWALKEQGYETIIANNNPETVSTDFDTADRLYFEPLTIEDVMNVIEYEKPEGVIVQFGGQTAIKLVNQLNGIGVRIFGTRAEDVDAAEDRERFDDILEKLGIPRPRGKTVYTLEQALAAANELIYPVLVRPSYVLGGQGMEIAFNDSDIIEFMEIINRVKQEHPILVDKYLMGKEIEVDAISDGENVLIPGIMEHLERAGVHSGDSISVYPALSLSRSVTDKIVDHTEKLARALNVAGMINIQYVLYNDEVYVLEVNPRSSRTVPYISKVTGIPMVNVATKVMTGKKLRDCGYGTGLYRAGDHVAVKVPVFSFEKLHDVDASLGPEMKSTGEVLGIGRSFHEALYKGIVATGMKLPSPGGGILMTVRDSDKTELIGIAEQFEKLGFELWATGKTARMLNMHGIATNAVKKIGEGSPNLLDLISSGKIGLVINTPTRGRQPERDGFRIRRRAVEMSIPCLTSLDTARAVLDCIRMKQQGVSPDVTDLGIFS
jgi:carbamoyl-phosphate synthase large subunit